MLESVVAELAVAAPLVANEDAQTRPTPEMTEAASTRLLAEMASVVLQRARSDILSKRKGSKLVMLIACCSIGACKPIHIFAAMENQDVYLPPWAKKGIQHTRRQIVSVNAQEA